MNGYTHTRVRGFADWRPQSKSRALVGQVEEVLRQYAEHLPLTLRQVFYRLVGKFDYPKDERAYIRLQEAVNRARRARFIRFDSIRDDGVAQEWPSGFDGLQGFWSVVRDTASDYRRNRLLGQPSFIEVWCEAAGMVPQLVRVAHPFGIPVFSSGGFDSTTAKYEAAKRIVGRAMPTVVLSVGDLDPSGAAMFDAANEDVAAFVEGMGVVPVEFVRVAVTREQVNSYDLPEKPAKATDRRGNWQGGTVQAEALDPTDLARELRMAIRERMDLSVYDDLLEREARERSELGQRVRELEGGR